MRFYSPGGTSTIEFYDQFSGGVIVMRMIGDDSGNFTTYAGAQITSRSDYPSGTDYASLQMDQNNITLLRVDAVANPQYLLMNVAGTDIIGNAAATNRLFLAAGSAQVELHYETSVVFGQGLTLVNPVEIRSGKVIGGNANWLCCSFAAFTATVGVRFTGAGAGTNFGHMFHYRAGVRSDSAGNPTTPAGAALGGTPISNTNASSPTIAVIRAEASQIAVNATAAGNGVYNNTVTFS